MLDDIRILLDNWVLLGVWLGQAGLCLVLLAIDLRRKNRQLMPLMKAVWLLTVASSGILGLLVYWFTGRRQISSDGLLRRGFRSTAHCYAGCGIGEVTGLVIAVGLLSLSGWWVSGLTFALAYIGGFALTAGPLIQDGEPTITAMRDAASSETVSIAVMEVVAIGVDRLLAGPADIHHALFWTSMMISLSCGLLAAWPVNIALIAAGVKSGMHDPRHAHHHDEHARSDTAHA